MGLKETLKIHLKGFHNQSNSVALRGNKADRKLSNSEVLFLKYVNGRNYNLPDMPGYWRYEYGIDCAQLRDEFLSMGYLRIADISYTLRKTKVVELKSFLEKHRLCLKGKKEELVACILSEIPKEKIEKAFSARYLIASDKGNLLLDRAEFLHYVQWSKTQISIDEAWAEKEQHPELNVYEAILSVLHKRKARHLQNKEWGLYRNELLSASMVLSDSNHPQEALKALLEVCYLDVNSGLITRRFIPPGVSGLLADILEELELGYSQAKEALCSLSPKYIACMKYSLSQASNIVFCSLPNGEGTVCE